MKTNFDKLIFVSDIAREREVEGDLILGDMGDGMPFKAGVFDGAMSISALQWLCNADKSHHRPAKRLFTFFTSLYACLSRGSKAVFQFYPENPSQIELITSQAMKSGFTGGLVVDYPNSTKAKKFFLVLMTGKTVYSRSFILITPYLVVYNYGRLFKIVFHFMK